MNTDVPPNIDYEFRRALAFSAVFDIWTVLGLSDDVASELKHPHEHTITHLMDEYPSLEPVLYENPVGLVYDELRLIGLREYDVVEESVETVREFFDEDVEYPFEMHLEEVEQ